MKIPSSDKKVINDIFTLNGKKMKVSFSGIESQAKQVLYEKVEKLGGEVSEALTKKTCLLVAKKSNTEKVIVSKFNNF